MFACDNIYAYIMQIINHLRNAKWRQTNKPTAILINRALMELKTKQALVMWHNAIY